MMLAHSSAVMVLGSRSCSTSRWRCRRAARLAARGQKGASGTGWISVAVAIFAMFWMLRIVRGCEEKGESNVGDEMGRKLGLEGKVRVIGG